MTAQGNSGATIGGVALPPAEALYLQAVVGRLAAVLGDGLVGVYPTGSVALGAYTQPGALRFAEDDPVSIVDHRPAAGASVDTVRADESHSGQPGTCGWQGFGQ